VFVITSKIKLNLVRKPTNHIHQFYWFKGLKPGLNCNYNSFRPLLSLGRSARTNCFTVLPMCSILSDKISYIYVILFNKLSSIYWILLFLWAVS